MAWTYAASGGECTQRDSNLTGPLLPGRASWSWPRTHHPWERPMYLSLRAAAKEAGIAKTTVIRAIRSGKLSAQRDETGGWAIDPSELHRVYPRKAESPEDQGGPGCAPMVPDRDATPS